VRIICLLYLFNAIDCDIGDHRYQNRLPIGRSSQCSLAEAQECILGVKVKTMRGPQTPPRFIERRLGQMLPRHSIHDLDTYSTIFNTIKVSHSTHTSSSSMHEALFNRLDDWSSFNVFSLLDHHVIRLTVGSPSNQDADTHICNPTRRDAV
jgi:hypothetical protein